MEQNTAFTENALTKQDIAIQLQCLISEMMHSTPIFDETSKDYNDNAFNILMAIKHFSFSLLDCK